MRKVLLLKVTASLVIDLPPFFGPVDPPRETVPEES